jgi:hypothetical protein|nr:MAG TPA: capsid assembly protein [Caudoviricetes sp.]
MAFEIFGYEISKKKDKAPQAAVVTPVTPRDDGASIVYSSDSGSYGAAAGYYGYQFDLDGVVRNESQMINQYRTVACFPEVDGAIEAIVNDAVIIEQGRDPVSLNLDGLPKQYHPLRDTIREHFDHVLNVLNFNDNCHDIFKRWYIDGRLYYYVMIDPKNPKKGIVDLKYIDPRKIRKVIEYQRENRNGIDVIVGQKSYYIFNDAGLQSAALGVKLSTDSIINVRSGLVDANTGEVISHLFKGIKPANQLKMMEDALVIYRITRAPERRVFYVDVGNLPGLKAEQYVNNVMNKFRNKVVYDAETGEVKNNRNYMSVCEDFFLPRREGGKATEIQTLPGGQSLNELADVEYFQKKLYQSLNVPRQRLLNDNVMSIGNPNEVTREELAFAKFIQRLRNRFNVLFKEALRIQLITTNCIRQSDWEKIRNCIYFEYQHDNYFEELKRIEVFNERMTQLQTADGFKGIYFSKEYIVRNILEMTQEEWEEIQQQMKQEKIDEAREASELENANAGDQESDDQFGQDSSEGEGDDGYNDFVSGNDSAPEEVDQEGDTTDTIDDTAEPNPGEDDFDRPATPGLKATM